MQAQQNAQAWSSGLGLIDLFTTMQRRAECSGVDRYQILGGGSSIGAHIGSIAAVKTMNSIIKMINAATIRQNSHKLHTARIITKRKKSS
jgi:hypothetical protein